MTGAQEAATRTSNTRCREPTHVDCSIMAMAWRAADHLLDG